MQDSARIWNKFHLVSDESFVSKGASWRQGQKLGRISFVFERSGNERAAGNSSLVPLLEIAPELWSISLLCVGPGMKLAAGCSSFLRSLVIVTRLGKHCGSAYRIVCGDAKESRHGKDTLAYLPLKISGRQI